MMAVLQFETCQKFGALPLLANLIAWSAIWLSPLYAGECVLVETCLAFTDFGRMTARRSTRSSPLSSIQNPPCHGQRKNSK